MTTPASRRGLLALIGAGAAVALARSAQAATAAPGPAPDFTLRSAGGPNLRLAEQRGSVVMVNFWATWCGPCLVEMPHLARLHEKYKGAGFALWGVSVDEDPKAATALAARLGVKFPLLFDTDKAVARLYALDSMPTTVLIDRDGREHRRFRGYRDGAEQIYERELRELIKA